MRVTLLLVADRSGDSAEDSGSVEAEASVEVVAKDADGSDGDPDGKLILRGGTGL